MFSNLLFSRALEVLEKARQHKIAIVTAESCTGGLLAALLTEVPGSSDVFLNGWVTYANEAKQRLLGVPSAVLEAHGAVSEDVARAMAEGALEKAGPFAGHSLRAVSITGIAGPGGGSESKPVGTVHIALAGSGMNTRHGRELFRGGRTSVRLQTVEKALLMLKESI